MASLFLNCSVWRQYAKNVAESLQRGMRVIVQGRLKQRSYETKGDGVPSSRSRLKVGPRAARHRKVTKTQRQGGGYGGGYGGPPSGGGYGGQGAVQRQPGCRPVLSGRPVGRNGGGSGGSGGFSDERVQKHSCQRPSRTSGALDQSTTMAKPPVHKPKRFACSQEKMTYVDYKDTTLLRKFISDRGKIRARRVTGNCTQHQRDVAKAVKNAREMALLPYTSSAR